MYKDFIEIISSPKSQARQKKIIKNLEQSFTKPIIHKEIHGDKVYVPLDLNRVWNRIN